LDPLGLQKPVPPGVSALNLIRNFLLPRNESSSGTGNFVGFFFAGTADDAYMGAMRRFKNNNLPIFSSTRYYSTPIIDPVDFLNYIIHNSPIACYMPTKAPRQTPWEHNLADDINIKEAMKECRNANKQNKKIVIIGWSRGAISALYLAQRCNAEGIQVQYLGMIDPVGTNFSGYSNLVPGNIVRVFRSMNTDPTNGLNAMFTPASLNYSVPGNVTHLNFTGGHASRSWSTIQNMINDAQRNNIPLK
jgi:hypothetical protein